MDAREDVFDVIVIGSGPGGYVAAGRAAQLGLKTAVIEQAELGGTCLNWGCIPTKALLHGAHIARTMAGGASVGVEAGEVTICIEKLVAHSRSTAGTLSSGVESLMNAHGAAVVRGTARICGKGRVEVSTGSSVRQLQAGHIIVATGAHARGLGPIQPDGDRIWTYREALTPDSLPRSLVIIGSGAIGSEFASCYTDLGTRVTLVEAADRLLPAEDPHAGQHVRSSLERRGVRILTGAYVSEARAAADGVEVIVDGQTVSADKVLLAVGVAPNTQGLGLEELGVLDDNGFVKTDELGKTEVWGLYAIGDVVGGPMLAHKASAEGIRCVDAIAGVDRKPPETDWRRWMPRCTYTFPEVASVGYTLTEARSRGFSPIARPIRFAENGRALGAAAPEGYAQVVVDEATGQLLGATIVGETATELISMLTVAHAGRMTAADFSRALIPHPTFGETVHESVLAALGRPVNSI